MKNYRIKKLLLLAILATSMQINAETKEVQIKIKDNNIESLPHRSANIYSTDIIGEYNPTNMTLTLTTSESFNNVEIIIYKNNTIINSYKIDNIERYIELNLKDSTPCGNYSITINTNNDFYYGHWLF